MTKVAIVTDSNSGITQDQADDLGVYVIPMPFMIDGETYFEDITLTQDGFYQKLLADAEISTSQPSPETVLTLWTKLLEAYDEIVYIPMSSGLSGSCQTAIMLAQDFDGKVEVVNNQRISVPLRQSVLDAFALAKEGLNAAQIKEVLEEDKFNSSIYIMLDTLYYLKKGGRITPAAAALGSLLKLKPVLQIHGDKLDAYAKARTANQGKQIMYAALKKDIIETFLGSSDGSDMWLAVAHTNAPETAKTVKEELEKLYPAADVHLDPLALSVSCHLGPDAVGVACTKKLDIKKVAADKLKN